MAEIFNLKHERLPDYFTHLFLLLIKLRLKRDISCVCGRNREWKVVKFLCGPQ